jgi:hypothetical protein
LQSGGEIYLSASQGSEVLRINHNNPLAVEFPVTGTPTGMQLFSGSFIQNSNVAADTTLNWMPIAADSANVVVDTTGGNFGNANQYYAFVTDSFGWSNCDRFDGLSGGCNPTIKLPTGFDQTNTMVYMIFNSEHTVATADIWTSPNYYFHAGTHTPIGLSVTIIAISQKGSNYYYDILPETTAANAVFNVTMTQAPLSTIQAAVGAL